MATRRPSSDAPGCTWINEFFLSRYSVPSPLSLWWMASLIDPAACSDMLTSDASGSFWKKESRSFRIKIWVWFNNEILVDNLSVQKRTNSFEDHHDCSKNYDWTNWTKKSLEKARVRTCRRPSRQTTNWLIGLNAWTSVAHDPARFVIGNLRVVIVETKTIRRLSHGIDFH